MTWSSFKKPSVLLAWVQSFVSAHDWIISLDGQFNFWWVFLPITLTIVLFGIGWNLLGDGLNDCSTPEIVNKEIGEPISAAPNN
ncbi:MAG TPA: hypothetical protein DIW44_03085 [Anaerolineaceae bacterium]|nr:hypothetical protein [Anaerolineaceae bacterium]